MSVVKKRSVSIRGHRTSFSLEDPFFDALADMAKAKDKPLASLIVEIDESRPREANLSSALRIAVLNWVRSKPAAGVS